MITSINEETSVKTRRRGHIFQYETAFTKLHDFIDKIDEKILSRLQLVQQTYLDDYKQQIRTMSEQLQILRANFDSQILNQKSNEKMYLLEEERDFFRSQLIKLNGDINAMIEENKNLKKKIFDLKVETDNYRTISINYEKRIQKLHNQKIQMANFKRESSVPALARPAQQQKLIKQEQQEIVQQQSKGLGSERHQTIEDKSKGQSLQNTMTLNSRANYLGGKQRQLRMKTYSRTGSATKVSIQKYEQANTREKIIDECIRQIKREIFYRTSQKKGNNLLPFDQFAKVSFQKFTKTDKKNFIFKLMSDQQIVDDFNQFLLSKNSNAVTSRMMRTKVGDEQFNTKFLLDLKRSFSKKIFDLKKNSDPPRQAVQKRKY